MLRKLSLFVTCALLPAASQAAVTININAALLTDTLGDNLPVDRPVFLVADDGTPGFGAPVAGTYGIGDAINPGGDRIVSIFDLAAGAEIFFSPGAASHSVTFDETAFGGSGTNLALYWFSDTVHTGTDKPDNVGPTIQVTLAGGASGNLYNPSLRIEGDKGAVDGSDEWDIPSEGFTVPLNFYTASASGSNPDLAGMALSGFVLPIPEPSAVASLLLGTLLVIRRRR